ncbi:MULTISPECIES: hypothetical protein [unclassified Anaeromyxobacter]|uniref:hypothetical protein n=1 Tax=unclassified Anaeromyxobacter TaxID=2620896 RepID=UPI001F56D56E|nr:MULTISPECIES: hypothetical protein [unclassified Anaeromyxobacter]
MRATGVVVVAAVLAAGCFSRGEAGRSSAEPPAGGEPPASGPPPDPRQPSGPIPPDVEVPASLLPVEAGVATSDRPCAGGWCWWNFPRGAPVRSMWGSGPSDVWATTTLGGMLHWDGAAWSAEWLGVAREPGGIPLYVGFDLRDVWGKSATEAWTADPLTLLRWDGTRWTRQARGEVFTQGSISSSDGVAWTGTWSCGFQRFDGTVAETFACPEGYAGDVYGVWAAGIDDVFGVTLPWEGLRAGVNTRAVAVVRRRGGSWSEWRLGGGLVRLPDGLGSISGSAPDDVWASALSPPQAGSRAREPFRSTEPTVWRFDGAEWWPQDASISGPVFVATRGDVWVGEHHLADGAWSEVADAPDRVLWAAGAHDVWGMRTDDVSGALYHWNGERWTPRAHLGGELRVIDRNLAPADEAWVLAPTEDGGAELVSWDGATWVRVSGSRLPASEVGLLYTATYGSSASDVWLAHRDGYLHWDGVRWTPTRVDRSAASAWDPRYRALREKLTGTGATDAWASNEAGVFHWDGERWTGRGSPGEVHAIWTPRPGLLFALGFEVTPIQGDPPYEAVLQQVIWRWSDGGWSEELRGATECRALTARDSSWERGAMWGATPHDAWALIGEVAYRWDGSRWAGTAGPTYPVRCIFGTGADDVWAVPTSRWNHDPMNRFRWDGRTWERAEMPVGLMCGSGAWVSHHGGLWRRAP